jgi:lantibiotic leader peptide-processing serine protease
MHKGLIGVAAGLLAGLIVTIGAVSGTVGGTQTYLVVYKGTSVASDAASTIQKAGGTLVASYSEIGVVVARSDSGTFRDALLKDSRIDGASSTTGFAYQLPNIGVDEGPPEGDLPNAPATDTDTFSGLQWDMRQIDTPEAHAITGGSPAVLVGDIDTGIDFNHPDLSPNIDVANSVNCLSGAPVAGLAAQDDNGHGTHTAGTIAAASNGIGIVGVAPNVHIAAIKSGNAAGYFFPEAVVCGFYWAATHHMDVTNNSYFADPWEYNCRNDPEQRAIWKAEQRSIRFAQQQGVTVVAAEGNDADDTAHPTQDRTSPDDSVPVTRDITNACVIVPVEVSGVIGVSATSNLRQVDGNDDPDDYLKARYSSYGTGVTDVAAPGGDSRFFTAEAAPNGRVLSTWPANIACAVGTQQEPTGDPSYPTAFYCYAQGTSMASPHVAGVAALIISRYGKAGDKKLSPGQVEALIQQTADPQPCPTSLPTTNPVNGIPYLAVTGTNSGLVQSCQGGPGHNSWYGSGQVNAFSAVTHNS